MNEALETDPPATPRPVRWDEAIVASYLYELTKEAA
jgi:hypothetical protein